MTARIRLVVLAFVVAYSVAFGPGQAFGGAKGSQWRSWWKPQRIFPLAPHRHRSRRIAPPEPLGLRARFTTRGGCSASRTAGVETRRRQGSIAPGSSASSIRTSASRSLTAPTRTTTWVSASRGSHFDRAISSSSTASATSACTSVAAASSTHRTPAPTSRSRASTTRGTARATTARDGSSSAEPHATRGTSGASEACNPGGTMTFPGTPFRAFVMDRPLLHTLVGRLRADERLPAFARALPARARVAEAALPLLLAALYEELDRGLCVLLADDADARDAAEAVGWFLGRGERRAVSLARGQPRLGDRTSASSRGRARPRPRRPRPGRPRLCLGARGRRAHAAAGAQAGAASAGPRRRARHRLGRRSARHRRLRPGRPCRRARPDRRARRARRRLLDHGPGAPPDRVLRGRDREHPRVLALHPAGAPRGRRGVDLSGRGATRPHR